MTTPPIAGEEIKARVAYSRKDSALYELTKLTAVPTISEGVDLHALKTLRTLPMEGERQIMWAVQDGPAASTRQVLPEWISEPIALKLIRWTHESRAWDKKIEQREGRRLTPAMQTRYDEWNEQTSEFRFLFNLQKECHITHIRDPTEVKRNRNHMFMVSVLPDADPTKLRLKTSDGQERRLVALRGQPVVGVAPTPEFLRKTMTEEEAERLPEELLTKDDGSEDDGKDDEAGHFARNNTKL